MGKMRSDYLLADYVSRFAKKRGFEDNPIKSYALLNLIQYLGEQKNYDMNGLSFAKTILDEPDGELADYLVNRADKLSENNEVISMFWDMVNNMDSKKAS